jgi:signal peptidase II
MPASRPLLFGSAGAIAAADRFTKSLVEKQVGLHESIPVVAGFFDIVHTRNRGIAFGLGNDESTSTSHFLLIAFTLAVLVYIGIQLLQATSPVARSSSFLRWALTLIFAGAAGNLYDRIALGAVTDFLDFYWQTTHFPAFNIADSAITIGAALLLLDLWVTRPGHQSLHPNQ